MIGLLAAGSLLAQAPTPKTATPKMPAPGPAPVPGEKTAVPLTEADLETFLDGFMPLQIGRLNIAGAVVAVVKDGKMLFAKGYGYADVAHKRPVVAESTLFRPGSISKLFTWTAVMQQVEQGKLDLDTDVNTYLDFKLPSAFGKPITLRDIMTHRAGYQETIKHLFVKTSGELVPRRQYLLEHMPDRIFPPGKVPAYSNYATTLAAYIVERVSGQTFEDYVDQHIFQPLDMHEATFRQPLPASLANQMSDGYKTATDSAKGFEFVEVAPAGSLSAAATDMCHFMIAHLQDGKYGNTQILQAATAQQMHSPQKGWPDGMHAMDLGFYEESRNGHHIIGHGGDTQWFHSDLHLILDQNVGFFVSYNSAGNPEGNGSARAILFNAFLDRYFPETTPQPPTLATSATDAKAVSGVYISSRRFETNLFSPLSLFGEASIVPDPKDSTLLMIPDQKGLNGQPVRYREIAPMRFREVGGKEQIAFANDSTGRRILYLDFPFEMSQRVDHTLNAKGTNLHLLIASLVIMALTLIGWPVGAMIRRHYGQTLELAGDARRLRLLVYAACILCFIVLAMLASFLNKFTNDFGLGKNGDFNIHCMQILGILTGLGAIAAIYQCIGSWRDGGRWIWAK
ncbi:MAG TPA: serine hydrolase domain-containing protein, partial [Gemmatimonadaceae bacterium]|nr:serine hydrolase domain-containing protein [Gemmatimonadaceae bacterium]